MFDFHEGTRGQNSLQIGDSLVWEFLQTPGPPKPVGRWKAEAVAYCDSCENLFEGDVQFDSLVFLGVDGIRQ
jgi:hypothetical protein